METVLYVIGGIACLFILVKLIAYANYRTCMRAYLIGFDSASRLTWIQLEEMFSTFLTPALRPMDAAAFRKGLEYFASSAYKGRTWVDLKNDFNEAWKSGTITNEGTEIRRLGYELSIKLLSRRLPIKIIQMIHANPNELFLASIEQLDSEEKSAASSR